MRIVTVVPLLLAGLALPATPATAAPAACFGLTPTIVGTPGESLTGTPGPDVVVTNGAGPVDTLAGADSVCVTGRTFTVETGPDDDRVDWTSPRHGGSVDLGGGSDSFVSGDGSSFVDSGDRDDARAGVALGIDTITTGSGRDTVITGHAGASGATNGDAIRLGGGKDEALVRGAVPSVLDGQAGQDLIALRSKVRGDWAVDGRTGVVSLDGIAMPAAASFSSYELHGLTWDSLVFRGGPAKETVDVANRNGLVKSDGPFTARMGPGDDRLLVRSQDTGLFSGGPGNDSIWVEAKGTASGDALFVANLDANAYTLSDRDEVRAAAIENLSVSNADRAVVVGDRKANRLGAYGCGNQIYGGAGDDRINGGATKGCYDSESTPGLTAYGEGGDDVLHGGPSADRLFGGPGRDKADGWYGRDQCVAETRTRCER